MKFNRILDDAARLELADAIEEMRVLAPDVIVHKIKRANVQQAFVFEAVQAFADRDTSSILAVGALADTAWAALTSKGWPMHAIDSAWGSPLAKQHADLGGQPSYDLIFSTSVIEHVEDDETFVRQIADLTRPGGHVILTMDFKPDWQPGMPKPQGDYRLYSVADVARLLHAMPGFQLVDEYDWSGEIDFEYDGCLYAFATLVAERVS
jgi:SAM-dependent methyltransferase